MKRYAVFGGGIYYPSGGIEDLNDSFYTIEESMAFLKGRYEKEIMCWFHIYDLEDDKFILKIKKDADGKEHNEMNDLVYREDNA